MTHYHLNFNFRSFYSFFFDFYDEFVIYYFSSHFFRSFIILTYSQIKFLEHLFILSNFIFLNKEFSLDYGTKDPINSFEYYEKLEDST